MACGTYGMSLVDFYRATPRETLNIVMGRAKAIEQQNQLSWEQTRWQTWHLVNIHIDRQKRISLQDLARFPWEQKQAARQMSLKDLKNFLN